MKHLLTIISISFLLASCGSDDRQFGAPSGNFGDTTTTTTTTTEGGGVITPAAEVTSEAVEPEQTVTSSSVRSNPSCDTLAFGDGRGGDLWLPVSAGDGLPVYLLNGAWQELARAEAELVSGGFEQGNFTGFNNPDPDGLRQHFRFTRSCEQYTGTVIVTDATQSCEVSIPRVCDRID